MIINLKFEDIENKMAEAAGRGSELKRSEIKERTTSKPSREEEDRAASKAKEADGAQGIRDRQHLKKDGEADNNANEDLETSSKLEELVVEDTPQ